MDTIAVRRMKQTARRRAQRRIRITRDDLPKSLARRIKAGRGCWEWSGWHNDKGYGYVHWGKRDRPVHRVIMEHLGRIAPGQDTDHLCRNRGCCNPAHLEAVSRRENAWRGSQVRFTKQEIVILKEYLQRCRERNRHAPYTALCAAFKSNNGNISRIDRGEMWGGVTLNHLLYEHVRMRRTAAA